jgi:hypothetical protein
MWINGFLTVHFSIALWSEAFLGIASGAHRVLLFTSACTEQIRTLL